MDTNHDQNAPDTNAYIHNRKRLLVIFVVIALVAAGLGVLFGKKILAPDNWQNVKGLTDEEKDKIGKLLIENTSKNTLSDEEKDKIGKLLIENTSKNTLSDEEKRAIEQRLSQ